MLLVYSFMVELLHVYAGVIPVFLVLFIKMSKHFTLSFALWYVAHWMLPFMGSCMSFFHFSVVVLCELVH